MKNLLQDGIENYSINLLWINKQKEIDQKYIHPAKSEEELITKFLTPSIKWAKANPLDVGAEINIWYDSELHESQAVLNTGEILNSLANQHGCNNIKIKDIRNINIVKQNDFLFNENIPLYFRIDFLKMIICLHSLKNEAKNAAIFSDLEVGDLRSDQGRMNKTELFDQTSMSKIKQYGIITNWDSLGKENQFIQVVNDEYAISALTHSINACLMRGTDTLNMPLAYQKEIMPTMHRLAFYSTINEISQYYMGVKEKKIKVRADFVKAIEDTKTGAAFDEVMENLISSELTKQWIEYNSKIHGYKPLGNYIPQGSCSYSYADWNGTTSKVWSKVINFGYYFFDSEEGVRVTDTRTGNAHSEVINNFPKANHTPFVCNFWEEQELGVLGEHQIIDEISN